MTTVTGLSAGHRSVAAAEHWLHAIVAGLGRRDGLVACTHLVRSPYPHVAVSLRVAGPVDLPPVPPELAPAAAEAGREHAAGAGGRLVVYPGVDALTGVLTVADLVRRSAVERVVVLGADREPASPGQQVDTRDFVRPVWLDGRVTLITQPAAAGRLVPFEEPHPRECCADH